MCQATPGFQGYLAPGGIPGGGNVTGNAGDPGDKLMFKLAAATKIRNTPLIKHIASRSPMKAMHEEMLDNSIAKLIGSEHILATNALVTVKLMGGAPKTLKLSKTLALGLKDMELKWNVHLEEIRASPRMIC